MLFTPIDLTLKLSSTLKSWTSSGFENPVRTEPTLTSTPRSSVYGLLYTKLLIPILSPSIIVSSTLVHPKNWVRVLDVYETIPVGELVLVGYLTKRLPEVSNPTVESTSIYVEPADTFPITCVFGETLKFP